MSRLKQIKAQFPMLKQTIHGKPLVYFDSAASSLPCLAVTQSLQNYLQTSHANIHRGLHTLSMQATQQYEQARKKVRDFIHAKSEKECIFVRGTTEACNLVAFCFGEAFVQPGDDIVTTSMEHHSNYLPWQAMCQRKKATLKILPMDDKGNLNIELLESYLGPKTKLLCLSHVSNALGTLNPLKEIITIAKQKNIPVFIDGAQAIPHMAVDVQQLDCDFYAFSGHKMYGPTGIGVLYAKKQFLDQFPPYQSGGGMVLQVSEQHNVYNEAPEKFEAGTPAIGEAIALGSAIDFLMRIGMDKIAQQEASHLAYLEKKLIKIPKIKIIGTSEHKTALCSFIFEDIHPHDVATILDHEGIAIRAGHHCAMPVMQHFQVPATVRVSLGIYNTQEDIDRLIEALQLVRATFKKETTLC